MARAWRGMDPLAGCCSDSDSDSESSGASEANGAGGEPPLLSTNAGKIDNRDSGGEGDCVREEGVHDGREKRADRDTTAEERDGDNADDNQEKKSNVKTTRKASICGVGPIWTKKKTTTTTELDYDALSRHGYSGGPSILYVPPPRLQQTGEGSWEWSSGKRKANEQQKEEMVESFEEREATRIAATTSTDQMASVAVAEVEAVKRQRLDAKAEARQLSFAQKEKRKRELGQSNRARNYVEEEKRLLRDQGVYSGYDQ